MSLMSRAGGVAFGLAGLTLIADQASKAWVLHGLALAAGAPRPVWGPLRFTLVENRGVSFGLFQGDAPWSRWLLAAFALAVAVGLARWVRRAERLYTGLALGLIIGGALGNFVDRVRGGVVVDFIDVSALMFPWVFNVADAAISIGIVLLLAEGVLARQPKTP